MRFLFELRDDAACSLQGGIQIFDSKEKQEAVSGRCDVRTRQRWVIVLTPLM
jgi:hypothetical protein